MFRTHRTVARVKDTQMIKRRIKIKKGRIFNHRDGRSELEKFEKEELLNEKTHIPETSGGEGTEDAYQSESEGC